MLDRIWNNKRLLTAGIAVLVLFAGLWCGELESGDETRVAGIAAEMFFSHDYLIPALNGEEFLEYPPFFYWCVCLMYALFGITDLAAKLPGALAAFGCVMLTFSLAREMKFSEKAAMGSALILLFSSQFLSESRICRVDMMLNFFILLSLYAFYTFMKTESPGKRAVSGLLFCAGLTGGILTKGLIGAVLPGISIGTWLIGCNILERKFRPSGYFYAAAGGIIGLALAGIWYLLLLRYGGDEMFHTALIDNNLGRFSSQETDHAESFFYYLPKLPAWFCPWVFLLPFALYSTVRRIMSKRDQTLLFPLLAFLIPFLIFCIASGKRTVYLLPLNAPCALLCGYYLTNPPERLRRWLNWITPRRAALILTAICAVVIGTDILLALHRNKKSLRPLFQYCAVQERQGKKVILYNPSERTQGAGCFYLHHVLPEKKGPVQLPPQGEIWIIRDKKNRRSRQKIRGQPSGAGSTMRRRHHVSENLSGNSPAAACRCVFSADQSMALPEQ